MSKVNVFSLRRQSGGKYHHTRKVEVFRASRRKKFVTKRFEIFQASGGKNFWTSKVNVFFHLKGTPDANITTQVKLRFFGHPEEDLL